MSVRTPNGFVGQSVMILLADGSRLPVYQVQPGMLVLNTDMEPVRVLSVESKMYEDRMYIFDIKPAKKADSEESTLLLTPSTPVLVAVTKYEAVYTPAASVAPGSYIVSEKHRKRVIRKLVTVRGARYKGHVFSINLETESAFFGNGIALGDSYIDYKAYAS